MTEKDGNFCYSPMKLKKRRINGSALVEEFFLCGEKLCGIVGQAGFDQPRGAKGVSQNQGWTGILETLWVGGGVDPTPHIHPGGWAGSDHRPHQPLLHFRRADFLGQTEFLRHLHLQRNFLCAALWWRGVNPTPHFWVRPAPARPSRSPAQSAFECPGRRYSPHITNQAIVLEYFLTPSPIKTR